MFKQLINTYKETVIYSLGNLANKLVGFILLPIYTSHITVEEYGILGLIEPSTQLLFAVLSIGLNAAFLRWYSIENNSTEKKIIFFNTTFVLITNTLFFVIIFTLFAGEISFLLFNNENYTFILKIAFINVFFLVVNPIFFSTLRVEHKSLTFSIINIVQFSLNLLFNIYFIIFLEYGLLSIFISQLISSVLVFIYFVPFYMRHAKPAFNFNLIKQQLGFGLPLVLVSVSQIVISLINRYILNIYDSLESIGLYSLAFRLSNTIKVLVIESITLSLGPILYQKLADPGGDRFVKKNFQYSVYLIMIVYLLAANFSREIIFLIAQDSSYYDAYIFIPYLAFVYVSSVMIYFHNILLSYAKKTGILSTATALIALVSLGINFILIPQLKGIGAALAVIFSNIFLFLILRHYSSKIYGHYFDDWKSLNIILTGLFITVINQAFFVDISVFNVIIKLMICGLFPVILYFFNFYEPVEILRIKQIFFKILKIR